MDSFESEARQLGFTSIAGIDEAGRGPLAGPVLAAAVILPHGYSNGDIRDSKKLTPAKREQLYETIHNDAVAVGLGLVEPSAIDDINILRATLLAMEKAVLDLSVPADYLLIDGRNTVNLSIQQKAIIKGDNRSISVAAASIIAKVSRDRIMDEYHHQFREYNFLKNKGYGTREHRLAIQKHGHCEIHRKSFKFKTDDLF
ncbi:MAG: ribonuclease HII [Deltaproteobacteria bacterium]|nr:ribonuclease HII [Deltaproteobacteria bacterium]